MIFHCIFVILPVDLVFALQDVMDNHGHQCVMRRPMTQLTTSYLSRIIVGSRLCLMRSRGGTSEDKGAGRFWNFGARLDEIFLRDTPDSTDFWETGRFKNVHWHLF